MSMPGYTKLFNSILASTIWLEDNETRIVWIAMLAMADKNGIVEASMPGLAAIARVSNDACQAALSKLSAPDQHSRSKDFEGRRVEQIEGGWQILNHAKYRAKMSADERREYNRIKQREFRARQSKNVNDSDSQSALSAHTEAEAYTKAEEETSTSPLFFRSRFFDVREDEYNQYTDVYPGVAVLVELQKMEQWLHANPERRKKNMKRFIVNWLAKTHRELLAAEVTANVRANAASKELRVGQGPVVRR